MELTAREARVEDYEPLTKLFERDAHDCHCQFWHFAGDKNGWIERCALAPEKNRDALREELAHEEKPIGVVAYDGAALVGWLRLNRRATLPKLLATSVYRDLGADHDAASIACVLVAEEARQKGVARALIVEAIAAAREHGCREVEAYPHRATFRLSDHEAWRGPHELFAALGFREVVRDERPGALAMADAYPVMRIAL